MFKIFVILNKGYMYILAVQSTMFESETFPESITLSLGLSAHERNE